MPAGARQVRSWRGEARAVPDGQTAIAARANLLSPENVVLVKASHAAGPEGVAAAVLAGGEDPPDPPGGRLQEVDK